MIIPSLVVHCDWSTGSEKRWLATASLREGRYHVSDPELVGPVDLVLEKILHAAPGPVLAGFDFFWTLSGSQVGRAAIAGWREFVLPALGQSGTSLWPLDGPLSGLLATSRLVIAETYPAASYGQDGIRLGSGMSKRRQSDRLTFSETLLRWASSRGHVFAPNLLVAIEDGFGYEPKGESMFDAVLGLCGMLEVVTGRCWEDTPHSDGVSGREGWILGDGFDHLAAAA